MKTANVAFVVLVLILLFGCDGRDVQATKRTEKINVEREFYGVSMENSDKGELEKMRKDFEEKLNKLSKENESSSREIEELKRQKEAQAKEIESLRQQNTQDAKRVFSSFGQLFGSKQETKPEESKKPFFPAPKPASPSVIRAETNREVPVGLESKGSDAFFKITDKKTGKFFVYEVEQSGSMGIGMSRGLSFSYKRIDLPPGEYEVEVRKAIPRSGYPPRFSPTSKKQTFTVEEEPIAETWGQKLHAVVEY